MLPLGRIGGFRFQQLGVGEDHAELIVQPVEQRSDLHPFERGIRSSLPRFRHAEQRVDAHAAGVELVKRCVPSGCRQSVSTKIRMLPPAVRTYSTLPAAIQL
jgi:hypothetical protein